MCNKLRDDCKMKNVNVAPPCQEPLPLPPYRISLSDTSYYTDQNSETSYSTVLEPRIEQVMAWMFNQMWDELTDNCIIEGVNESNF